MTKVRKVFRGDCRGCGREVELVRQKSGENVEIQSYSRIRCAECETITAVESTGSGDGSVLDSDGPWWYLIDESPDVVFDEVADA
jgi:DNA-directed RNA polymerase subunit RPC12/RpoP